MGRKNVICNCIVQAVAFICITYAAIRFGRMAVLCWYLAPFCMFLETIKKDEGLNDRL